MKETPLPWWKIAAYSMPAGPSAAVGLPIAVYIPPFYASQLGIELTTIGLILMLMKFWDVCTDPVLGIVSDRYPSRFGRRRHWMVISTPILMFSCYMLFMPDLGVGPIYLTIWMVAMYVGWTLLSISHMAWGTELSPFYSQRSRIHGWREGMILIGMLLTLMLPFFVEQFGPEAFGFVDRGESTLAFARVSVMGWFVIIALPITVLIAIVTVDERRDIKPNKVDWSGMWRLMVSNIALRRVLLADFLSGINGGATAALFLFLAEDALQLEQASLLLLVFFASGLLFLPLMIKFSYKLGKHRMMAYTNVFIVVTVPALLFIPTQSPLIATLGFVILGLNVGVAPTIFRSLMADIADDHTVNSGAEQTGLFYSLLTLTNKCGSAIAIGVAYIALDAIGFTAGGDNSESVLFQFRFIFISAPVLTGLFVAWLMWSYPLDEKKQIANRKILDEAGHRNASPELTS